MASLETRSFTGARGVGLTGMACSGPTMADGPGDLSAFRAGRLIMTITASPVDRDLVWAGTEPSEVWPF